MFTTLDESILKNRALRWTLGAIWLALLTAVVLALRIQGSFFAMEGKPIAKLAFKKGYVQVRSEELVTWREVDLGNGFYEGDRVATGLNSKARISFSEGREIIVGEDSQIMITAIQQGDDYSFIVNLLKGSVEGSQRVRANRQSRKIMPLQIKSGAKVVTIESAKSVGLLKPVGAPAREYVPQPVARRDTASVASPVGESPPSDAVPSSTPTPSPSALPELVPIVSSPQPSPALVESRERAKLFSAVLAESSRQSKDLMILGSFSTVFSDQVTVDLRPPARPPQNSMWRPAVQVSGGRGNLVVITGQGFRPQSIAFSLETALRRAIKRPAVVGQVAEFSYRAGAVLNPKGGGKREEGFDGPSAKWTIHSITEGVEGGLTVALDRLANGAEAGLLWPLKPELDLSNAPYIIKLRDAARIAKLRALIIGAGRVGFAAEGPGLRRSVFEVTKGEIVAQLSGTDWTEGSIAMLSRMLDADFAFRGTQASMFDTRRRSAKQLLEWMEASLDQGRSVQVMRSGRLFPINRDFIQTNPEVAEFVGANARAVFVDQVEIVYNRQ